MSPCSCAAAIITTPLALAVLVTANVSRANELQLTAGPLHASANVPQAEAAVNRMRGGLRSCYLAGLASEPDLGGGVTLTARLGADGGVLEVIATDVQGVGKLLPCLEAVMLGGAFAPPASGGATVTLPLTFVSSRPRTLPLATTSAEPTAEATPPIEAPLSTMTPLGSSAALKETASSRQGTKPGASSATQRLGNSLGPKHRFDLNLEGGLGALADGGELAGFGRLRAGWLAVHESDTDAQASPLFFVLGATYEASNLSPATLGLQTEFVHVGSGFWAQLGGFVDVTRAAPGWMGSVGWSVVGAELQHRAYEHDDGEVHVNLAVFGKLRLPLTLLLGAL